MLEEAFMPHVDEEDDQLRIKQIKETITSVNSVILCDSIESAINLSYDDLNKDKIAEAT